MKKTHDTRCVCVAMNESNTAMFDSNFVTVFAWSGSVDNVKARGHNVEEVVARNVPGLALYQNVKVTVIN